MPQWRFNIYRLNSGMKNLIVRSLSGAVYAALIVCAIMFGGAWAFPALCTVFAILGTGELTRLCYGTRTPALTALDMAGAAIVVSAPAACLVCASGGIYTASLAATGAFFVYFLARLICQLYLPGENAVGSISAAFTSLMYVAMPLCCASMMYLMYGPSIILTMFIMIWLNDTGAFCVGSLIGKRRLFERISPKKSWEGFAGGLVFSIAGGALILFSVRQMGSRPRLGRDVYARSSSERFRHMGRPCGITAQTYSRSKRQRTHNARTRRHSRPHRLTAARSTRPGVLHGGTYTYLAYQITPTQQTPYTKQSCQTADTTCVA